MKSPVCTDSQQSCREKSIEKKTLISTHIRPECNAVTAGMVYGSVVSRVRNTTACFVFVLFSFFFCNLNNDA